MRVVTLSPTVCFRDFRVSATVEIHGDDSSPRTHAHAHVKSRRVSLQLLFTLHDAFFVLGLRIMHIVRLPFSLYLNVN
jgi:hypothetical protein